MSSSYRIIAADSSSIVPNIARAAMDLIERSAVVIDVRSGDAALAEIERGDVDLLVSAYNLADMRGFELALKANQTNETLPVIILASANDPEVDEETRNTSPFQYLVRSNEGVRFVSMIRALLDGEEPSQEAGVSAATGPDLGPIPSINLDAFGDSLNSLLTDVGAMAVVLVDRKGEILQELGAVGYLDRDRLTSTLVPIFANMVSIGPLVGGKPQAMNFYDGDEFDIFALAVGLHHFICLIFEGSAGSRAFGAVTMYGRRAVQEMLDVIGDVAYEVQKTEAVAPAKKRGKSAKVKKEPAAKAKKKAEAKAAPAKEKEEEYTPPRPPQLDPMPEDADLESMLAGLDKLDLDQADALFDPEKMAEIAAEKRSDERLSFEEAQQMGVLQQND